MSSETKPAETKPAKKQRYFYGWNIVGASFMAHLAYAEHFSSTLGLFFRPLNKEYGWSRTSIALVQTIARVVEAGTAPLIGPLIDRYGPRILMTIGAVVVGIAMLWVTQVNSLWQFYAVRGVVVALGFTLMGGLVTNVAINNWFVRKRGRAIAIAGVGSQLGNVILLPLTVWIIATSGWRTSFVVFAILTWLVVLLPAGILMRRRPEDVGLAPDGDPPAAEASHAPGSPDAPTPVAAAPEPIWSRRELLRTPVFWFLAAAFAIDSLAFQGVNISLAPYIEDLGYSDATKATVITMRAALQALLLPVMGFIAEKASRATIRSAPFLFQGLAAFFFLLAGHSTFLWMAVISYGIGLAGIIVVQEVLWANYFGRLSLGMVRSTGYVISFGFGAMGPVFMNLVFDLTGSYRPAFALYIFLFGIAAALAFIVRPPKATRYATPEEMAALSKGRPRGGGRGGH